MTDDFRSLEPACDGCGVAIDMSKPWRFIVALDRDVPGIGRTGETTTLCPACDDAAECPGDQADATDGGEK